MPDLGKKEKKQNTQEWHTENESSMARILIKDTVYQVKSKHEYYILTNSQRVLLRMNNSPEIARKIYSWKIILTINYRWARHFLSLKARSYRVILYQQYYFDHVLVGYRI